MNRDRVVEGARILLEGLGVDLGDEHFMETPNRVARAMIELTSCPDFSMTSFANADSINEMIVSKDIPFYSLCAHHLLPFFGRAHVAYIPGGRIVGLSKLARVVEFHARGLQIQEKLTHQVCTTLEEELQPLGVAVVLEAEHLCQTMRGIRKPGARAVTSAMRGAFLDSTKQSRAEFLNFIQQ